MEKCVLLFFATLPLYHKANEEAWAVYYTVIKHSEHLRTLEKYRKHSPAARVFYISLVFSNPRRVLSLCKTRLRLLYLLTNITYKTYYLRITDFTTTVTLYRQTDRYLKAYYGKVILTTKAKEKNETKNKK